MGIRHYFFSLTLACSALLAPLCLQGATACLDQRSYRIRLTQVQRSGGDFRDFNGNLSVASVSIQGTGGSASGGVNDLNVDRYFTAAPGAYLANIGGNRFNCTAAPGGGCSASFTWKIYDLCNVEVGTVTAFASATITLQNGNRLQTPNLACNITDNRAMGCPSLGGGCMNCQGGDENLARYGSDLFCSCGKFLYRPVSISATGCGIGTRTLPAVTVPLTPGP